MQGRKIKINTKQKITIIIGIFVIFLCGELLFFKRTIHKKKSVHLIGTNIAVLSTKHVLDKIKIQYNSDPPSSGAHYEKPQHAGIYTTPPPDGNLVHSLEHGAVILWYNPRLLSQEQVVQLKNIFISIKLQKIIMTPRNSLAVPVALSSWGRIEKLLVIDEKRIKQFFYTNYDHGHEEASI